MFFVKTSLCRHARIVYKDDLLEEPGRRMVENAVQGPDQDRVVFIVEYYNHARAREVQRILLVLGYALSGSSLRLVTINRDGVALPRIEAETPVSISSVLIRETVRRPFVRLVARGAVREKTNPSMLVQAVRVRHDVSNHRTLLCFSRPWARPRSVILEVLRVDRLFSFGDLQKSGVRCCCILLLGVLLNTLRSFALAPWEEGSVIVDQDCGKCQNPA
mmetsp:Transcript_45971/g.99859  ORF Transcript_45971/g.99859 Transcript_45971/m.99859 type:complete len:218 (+) Transcript_45971:581-1234(+)